MSNVSTTDAETLDGQDSTDFAASGHTHPLGDVNGHDKAAHDSLGIDADTVDGQHAGDLGKSDAEVLEAALPMSEGFAPGYLG